MNYQTIDAKNYNRLSEFMNYLPKGILNKVKTDTGGTYLAANCPENYIIVCPLNGLIDSIAVDKNNKYEIFVCRGGVKERDWKEYASRNKIHKIAVTWDSFHKLITWLPNFDYKVVADEYHLILQNMDYREEAINQFMIDVKKFTHYTFMSATPIDNEFEPDFFKDLPHYKIDWGEFIKVMPIRFRTTSLIKGLTRIIQIFLDEGLRVPDINDNLTEVKEMHIFINSVTSIKQILDTIKYDDVKIVCANRIRNRKLLGKYEVNKVTDPNRTLNFYTSTAFQGCNMFTNNGLIVVASDAYKTKDMIDISSDLEQIIGRFRFNKEYQNCFRNTIVHIYSTNSSIPSNEEFEQELSRKIKKAEVLKSGYDKLTIEERDAFNSSLNLDNDVVSITGNKLYINDLKINMFRFKQSLKVAYKDGYSIRKSYAKSEKFAEVNQQYWEDLNIKMARATTFNYKDLYKDYLSTKDNSYLLEYPEFKDYELFLKETEMNSLSYNKDKLARLVRDKKYFRYKVMKDIVDIYGGEFVSSKELKEFMKSEFAKYNITQLKPKASLVEEYGATKIQKKINCKNIVGYQITNLLLIF